MKKVEVENINKNRKGNSGRTHRILKRAGSAVLILIMITMISTAFSSCSKLNDLKYNSKDKTYVDSKTGIAYCAAPGCYEFDYKYTIGDDYCKIGDSVLFSIVELDPKMWLYDKNTKTVFYNSEIDLPLFESMTITEIKLCYQDALTAEFHSITDKDEIKRICKAYTGGEEALGFSSVPENTWAVKFAFEECPGIFYNLMYTSDDNGTAFLSNRYEKRTVSVGSLLDKYKIDYKGDQTDSTETGN